jgi:hypothetical protein
MLDQILPVAMWQIMHGNQAGSAVLWLQALGTGAVVVPDKTSPEAYHDYTEPHKFIGVLPTLYDDHAGTAIYRVPRIHPGIGRVVDKRAIAAVGPLRSGDDTETLTKYVNAVENPDQPPTPVTWTGFDHVGVQATVSAGQSVLLQETWDPSWHAEENGTSLSIRPEPLMGFMLIDASPGPHNIRMRFETPLENRFGQILFALSSLILAALVFRWNSTRQVVDRGTTTANPPQGR